VGQGGGNAPKRKEAKTLLSLKQFEPGTLLPPHPLIPHCDQVDFFRMMEPELRVTFPPATALGALRGVREEAAGAEVEAKGGHERFVFYAGVVPFVSMEVLEPRGVLDKFGPPAFFVRVDLLALPQGREEEDHTAVVVWTDTYFCAAQVLLCAWYCARAVVVGVGAD
jgi:hypothetical protein